MPAQEAFERIEDVLQIHHEGGIDYYNQMREFYLKEISRWRGVRIDASAGRHPEIINAEIWDVVKKIL